MSMLYDKIYSFWCYTCYRQQLVQTNNKASHEWLYDERPIIDGGFFSQKYSHAENVPLSCFKKCPWNISNFALFLLHGLPMSQKGKSGRFQTRLLITGVWINKGDMELVFMNSLWAHNHNPFDVNLKLRIHIGHNFAYATTAQLLRHVHSCSKLIIFFHEKSNAYFFSLQDLVHDPIKCWWNESLKVANMSERLLLETVYNTHSVFNPVVD